MDMKCRGHPVQVWKFQKKCFGGLLGGDTDRQQYDCEQAVFLLLHHPYHVYLQNATHLEESILVVFLFGKRVIFKCEVQHRRLFSPLSFSHSSSGAGSCWPM